MTAAVTIAQSTSITAALARRSLAERRRFIIGLTTAVVLFAVMVGSLYSSMGDAYDEVFEELPAALEGMLGDADFSTAEGFIQVELFSFLGAVALTLAAGISIGAGALAGAEQSGRLSLITASPVPRSNIVSATMVAALAAIATVATGLFAGIVAGGVIGDLDIAIAKIGVACLSLALLAAVVASITVAAAALTGKRALALGAGTTVAVASYAIDAFFPLSTTLEPLAKFSLWYPYANNQPLVNGLDAGNVGILVVIGVAATAVAYWAFERRDLG